MVLQDEPTRPELVPGAGLLDGQVVPGLPPQALERKDSGHLEISDEGEGDGDGDGDGDPLGEGLGEGESEGYSGGEGDHGEGEEGDELYDADGPLEGSFSNLVDEAEADPFEEYLKKEEEMLRWCD
jgi:hypothetical protein